MAKQRRGRGDGTVYQRPIDTTNRGGSVTLTEFLLARIAEDEAVAKGRIRLGSPPSITYEAWQRGTARALAECEAKRRILDEATEVARHERTVAGMAGVVASAPTSGETIIRLLVLPYADHPDYREEWKP